MLDITFLSMAKSYKEERMEEDKRGRRERFLPRKMALNS